MKLVVIIPARGGSKSVPGKNIRLLDGKPLIQYSVEYALLSGAVAHTVVSTDSLEIAETARVCGAEVPFIRPSVLGGDLVQDFGVMHHALLSLEKHYGETIELMALLRPTSPLRPPGLIERALALLEDDPNASSLRSVVVSEEHPYRQWIPKDGAMVGYERSVKEPYNLPRQLLPAVYFQSGDLEVVRRRTLLHGSVSGDRVLPLIVDRDAKLDIDRFTDLQDAEIRMAQKGHSGENEKP